RSSVRLPTDSAQPCARGEQQRTDANAAPNRQAGGHWFEPSTAHRKPLQIDACRCPRWRRESHRGKDQPCHGVRSGRARATCCRGPTRRLAELGSSEDPHLLETSVPGIFACGDVRLSPVKRVAAAVGEGSMAIAFGHQYLKQAPAIAEPLAWRRRPAPLDQRVSLAPPLTADERGVGPTPLRHSTHLHTSPPCRREAGVL